MALKKAQNSRLVLNEEVQFSTQVQVPSALHPVVRARVVEGNYKKAESLLWNEAIAVPDLQKVRTLLSRGKLEEAGRLIEKQVSKETLARSENQLEKARLLSFGGKWVGSIQLCTELLNSEQLAGISRLTVFQIRANALFEVGEFHKSLRDIENAEPLLLIYPSAPSGFYLKILHVKVLLKLGETTAADYARNLLVSTSTQKAAISSDELLALFRLESYVARQKKLPFKNWAYCAYVLSKAMGDDLYAGLALVEWSLGQESMSQDALGMLEHYRRRFSRVESLFHEMKRPEKTEQKTEKTNETSDFVAWKDFSSQFLVILPWNLILNLDDVHAWSVHITPQIEQFLRYFQGNAVSERGAVFQSIWNLSYREELHKDVLNTAFKRLKAATRVPFAARLGKIQAPRIRVI